MDWINVKARVGESLKKYRYMLLIFLLGIVLMCLPQQKHEEIPLPQPTEATQPDLQDALSALLSKIAGAGRVEVLLTQAAGAQTLYQTDEDRTQGDTTTSVRRETVLVTNSSREGTGLVKQINPPSYLGAVILCQGADDTKVKLAIVEAVANATGLTTDKISVLKMK